MDHPDQRQLLLDDPSLVPSAVEESRTDVPRLRPLSPYHDTRHLAGVEANLRGRKGRHAYVSSNRDESRYDDPDRFDVTRNPEHQAFGVGGPHFCLGAALARLASANACRGPQFALPGDGTGVQARVRGVAVDQPAQDAAGPAAAVTAETNDSGGMMSTVTDTPAIATARRGFDSLEEETHLDGLPVQGELPPWLQGSLIRTGPAKWEVGDRAMNHWFDGFAMLHRFSFADGDVSYANRFLESRAYRAARDQGRIAYSEFATDPCRSLFARVSAMFSPKLTDNANVNLDEARRALHLDDRDADPGRVRRRDARRGGRSLQAAGTALHRPSTHGPRHQGDAELRGEARPADQLPVLPAPARAARSPR